MAFWTPEQTPPQISSAALETIVERVRYEGVMPVACSALDKFGDAESDLLDRIDMLSFKQRDSYKLGVPQRIMRIGASLTWLAYRETGYYQSIDEDTQVVCSLLAEVEGVPETYYQSLWQDLELLKLLGDIKTEPDLAASDDGSYQHLMDVGAGFVRYNLEGALKAA